MGKFIDLTGKKFGKWTVLKRAANRGKTIYYLCQCDCGTIAEVRGTGLSSGHTKSCGCLHKEIVSKISIDSRYYKKEYDRLRTVYFGIKNRCYNKNTNNYYRYGAKGITMCEEWKNNGLAFCEWAIANGYNPNAKRGECTLDRIDNNKGYSPDNCRWITNKEQCRNKRNTIKFTINNETKSLKEWCEIYNIKYSLAYYRLKRGWTLQKALTR